MACKKTNRARPDLTQTYCYTLINNKLTPRQKFSSVILTGSEPLEIHSYFPFCMLFVVDLQYIAARKVKSGCALNPKLCPQSRESEPNFHEFMALSRATFQYNGSTGYPVCLTRRESEPVCRKFTALSPMIRTLQSTTGNLHNETTGKPQGRRPRHEDGRSMQGRVTQST